jgi:hypothetical protein
MVEFTGIQGRTVEKVQLCTSASYHSISILFEDKTDLTLVIDSWFTFQADYYDWKTGDQKVLKSWPVVKSEES